jgi:hypothetical protein
MDAEKTPQVKELEPLPSLLSHQHRDQISVICQSFDKWEKKKNLKKIQFRHFGERRVSEKNG